jgi:hypothetical protein
MKFIAGTFLALISCSLAAAQGSAPQGLPSGSLTKGAWELTLLGGGGPGLAGARNTEFMYAGARIGRVLTGNHLSGWRRGNFEWAVDLLPVYAVLTPNCTVYGSSFKPAIWQWNFTGGKRIAPYIAVAGGIVFSRRDVPPGNTSWVNFTPQGAFGAHIFLRHGRALLVEGAVVHHSNADLGTNNPGYNASLLFTVGYSWFTGGK